MTLRELILIGCYLTVQFEPSNGLQCIVCRSDEDENCSTLKQGNFARLEDCDGNCTVWIDGENTLRGCDTNKPAQIEKFESCGVDGCNKGIYPLERLKCIKCSEDDESCVYPTAGLLFPCKSYVEDDFCYTVVIDEVRAVRGCLSDRDTDVETCETYDDICVKCNEEICNLQGGKSYVSCLECSSEDNEGCGYTQEGTQSGKLCEALYGRENLCFAYANGSHAIRGCLNDFPELKSSCAENNFLQDCEICDDDGCNSMKIVREYCFICNSTVDSDCKFVPETPLSTECGEGTIDKSGCYLYDKDGATARGCVTSLSDEQFRDCQDGEFCKICHGDMCNVEFKLQKCYVCNSQDDPNCATVRTPLTEKVCENYFDTCKVYVKPNSTTHRGCYKDDEVECPQQANNCKKCSEDHCNGEVFPATRLSCHQCEGSNAASDCYKDLSSSTDFLYPCETYNFRDSCYMSMDSNKVVHRGCLSDANEFTDICQTDPTRCRVCTTSSCNAESVMKAPKFSCISCDSFNEIECSWGYQVSMGRKCEKDIMFHETESCYILPISANQTARGCTLDGNICRSSLRCTLCTEEDVCNRENMMEQQCHECSSETDQNCGPEPFHTRIVTCPGIVTYDLRGCYTWVDGETVDRGCFSSLSAEERLQCVSEERCPRCVDEQNCNNHKINFGGRLTGDGFVVGVGFVFLMEFMRNYY